MCLGVPMEVVSANGSAEAQCRNGDGSLRTVDTLLLDVPPQPGDWLLVHVRIAIRPLNSTEAVQIRDALHAVTAAAAGEAYEHLIADLVDREPELPAHLRPVENEIS
ncbi:MAG: HypC/HybG/HupF family hydrogenase formation chaperone [Pseudomonadota bacterium]